MSPAAADASGPTPVENRLQRRCRRRGWHYDSGQVYVRVTRGVTPLFREGLQCHPHLVIAITVGAADLCQRCTSAGASIRSIMVTSAAPKPLPPKRVTIASS